MVDPPPVEIASEWHAAMARKKKKADRKRYIDEWQKWNVVKEYSVTDRSFSSLTPEQRTDYWENGVRPAHGVWDTLYPSEENRKQQFITMGEAGYTNYSGIEKHHSKMTEAERKDEYSAKHAKTMMVAPPAHETTGRRGAFSLCESG